MLKVKIIKGSSREDREELIDIDDFIESKWNDQRASWAFAKLINILYQNGAIDKDDTEGIVESFIGNDILLNVLDS